jgi:hypothetical protein
VVSLRNSDGDEQKVMADYVVGADGARSVVRGAMKASYSGGTGGRPNVNITFRAPGLAARVPHKPSVHYWILNRDAPGVMGPLDRDDTWWASSAGRESIKDIAEAEDIVDQLIGERFPMEILATDPWQARLLLVDKYREGRLFLIGDAAHQNPPWGGHGFNTGIGDAMNLAWKLAAQVQGWAGERLLDSYQSERRPIAEQTIDLSENNMRALSVDLAESAVKNDGAAIRADKTPEFHSLGLVLGYGYGRHSAAQAPQTDVYVPLTEAGNRLPHGRLPGGSSLFDRLGRGMTVFGDSADSRELSAALEACGVPVPTVSDEQSLKLLGASIVVVRPDQHIAWAGESVDSAVEIAARILAGF